METEAAVECLKYLFGVKYNDGSEFYQTPEDVSTTGKGSAFTDVAQDEVRIFQLASLDTKDRYLVDLSDGHFEAGGLSFYPQIPPRGAVLRLIYFRRWRRHMYTGPGAEKRYWSECEYHFGWQCTHEGQNYQQAIILM